MVSCSLAAARVAARLTARVVQPTPPAAPVTVMILRPARALVVESTRGREPAGVMISRSSVGSGRQGEELAAPARMAFKIRLLSELRLAGRTIAPGSA